MLHKSELVLVANVKVDSPASTSALVSEISTRDHRLVVVFVVAQRSPALSAHFKPKADLAAACCDWDFFEAFNSSKSNVSRRVSNITHLSDLGEPKAKYIDRLQNFTANNGSTLTPLTPLTPPAAGRLAYISLLLLLLLKKR